MHLNYYFLRKLTTVLTPRLQGTQLSGAFSQDKDEIVLEFGSEGLITFTIRAILKPNFTSLYFPDKFERARANSVDLFKELYGREVQSVAMYENERAFALQFDSGEKLVFKLFGNRSNLLYFGIDGQRGAIFNHRLKTDLTLEEASLNRPLEQSYDRFVALNGEYRKMFPTFGRLVNQYLSDQFSDGQTLQEQWSIIVHVLDKLNEGRYYLTKSDSLLMLSLLRVGDVQQVYEDPLEAANAFCLYYLRTGHLQKEKEQASRRLKKRIQQTESYLASAYEKLDQISDTGKNEQYANLLMAHLHLVEPRAEFIELENFYTGEPVKIRLKPDLSPAKNAEAYFRKAKNEKVEIAHLQRNIEAREAELVQISKWLTDLEELPSVKELRTYLKQNGVFGYASVTPADSKFRKEVFMGYDIYIGKSARNNDELTLKHAGKDDLWLHARDVSGSHVVIKNIPGKKTPPDVIERAAELAAWHSKRRNDSLCPVTVTPKKFVRKGKGMAPGTVVVEKESVVMVVPRG